MRLLKLICLISFVIASLGCAGPAWNTPTSESGTVEKNDRGFWKNGFGKSSGVDPRAREIEKSLGY